MPVKRLSSAVPISHARPVRQARSRRTLQRLLDAAEASLEREGLDGTTVPAIAGRAGVSVGVVYRRFPDKDALLRAVYERFFARAREGNRAALAPARWKDVPTGTLARALVLGMVHGYRQRPGLLRALFLYSQAHDDPKFRRRADRVTSEASAGIESLLLSRRREVAHPDPAAAIHFAVLALGSVLRTFVLSGGKTPKLPAGERLEDELVRLFLRYLGISEPPRKRAPERVAFRPPGR